jgi:hypothetical protein
LGAAGGDALNNCFYVDLVHVVVAFVGHYFGDLDHYLAM